MLLLQLFVTFFKIGLFTIGGGYAMIPLIQADVVANGWIAQQDLIDLIAVSESTPGPFAVNIATFVGMHTGGVPGAISATLGVILPSFFIILLIAKYFMTFKDNRYVRAALTGLRPAVIGLIGAAGVSIAWSNFFPRLLETTGWRDFIVNHFNYKAIVIFLVFFLITRKWKLHPILMILLAAGLGIVLFGLLPF